jgi:hypothetical protein
VRCVEPDKPLQDAVCPFGVYRFQHVSDTETAEIARADLRGRVEDRVIRTTRTPGPVRSQRPLSTHERFCGSHQWSVGDV